MVYVVPDDASIEIYISIIAVLLTIIGYILSITNHLIAKQMSPDMFISVDVNTYKNDVIISCIVENKGENRISNMDFFLFIDQPIFNEKNRVYEYNYILKHKYDCEKCANEYLCKLSKYCSNKLLSEYLNELKMIPDETHFYGFKRLDFLSDSSVQYINPGERFSEDVSFNLKKGAYRVILVGRFNKDGCLCANKQFIIQ